MAEKSKKRVGRPPKYTSKEEIQEKIDVYFKDCEGEILKDKEGNIVFTSRGDIVYTKEPKPPTITGLALALGFATRGDLLRYQGKKEFSDTITRAKSFVEEYTERRLFDRDGVQGAKFSLINNFKDWNDKPEKEEKDDFTAGMIALANLLNKPQPNRNIKDFEGDN